jgi:hypothetical protein
MDRFPSIFSGSEAVHFTVHAAGAAVVIDGDSSAGYCQPTMNDMCQYYIAVITEDVDVSALFTVSSTRFGDVQHIPCDDYPNSPDGIRRTNIYHSTQTASPDDTSAREEHRQFELCTGRASDEGRVVVSLEKCFGGELDLFVCEDSGDNSVCVDFLPSPESWEYRATSGSTCHRQEDASRPGRPAEMCEHNEGQGDTNMPIVSLPLTGGAYFLQVMHTNNLGRPTGPR